MSFQETKLFFLLIPKDQYIMAFLGNKSLTAILKATDVISPFDEKKIINGAYELTLGGEVFQTGAETREVKKLSKSEKIYIDPGQFALLITQETVKIPNDKIAFISIKAGIKFNGLVNVSGFHVDPGFPGKLLFSVYNAGPATIVLSQGTSYFPIWFADLSESQLYQGSHSGQNGIPDEPVKMLSQGVLASPNELSRRIDEVKHLKTKIEWVFLAILTLAIGISVKLWTDHKDLKDAVEFGYTKRSSEIAFDSTLSKLKQDNDSLHKLLDSTLKIINATSQETPVRTPPRRN